MRILIPTPFSMNDAPLLASKTTAQWLELSVFPFTTPEHPKVVEEKKGHRCKVCHGVKAENNCPCSKKGKDKNLATEPSQYSPCTDYLKCHYLPG